MLAGLTTASALASIVFSPDVRWPYILALGIGATLGGLVGAWMLRRVDDGMPGAGAFVIGLLLTEALFLRPVRRRSGPGC